MQQNLPFRFQESFKLTSLGLDPNLFKFGNLTFESQKYIVVKDGANCNIIDTSQNFKLESKAMKGAESILMHRERNIIAVRATQGTNTVVQVFDLDGPKKLKQTEVKDTAVYWRWINLTTLAVIGKSAVFHIDISNNDAPTKMFDRNPQMASCQIMSYDVNPQNKCAYLVGLYSSDQRSINGQMQFFNFEKKQQTFIEGYSGCFADLPVTDTPGEITQCFAFCEKKSAETTQRVHIIDVGSNPGQSKFKVTTELQMAADAPGDFPVLMQAAPKYGIIFMITKFGYLFMIEASKGALIYRQRVTDQLIFASVRNTVTDGMICINKVGQVLSINVEENNLVSFIMSAQHIPDNKTLAFKLASKYHLAGADEIFQQQFNTCVASGDYAGAARAARDAPGTLLRNAETIQKFKSLPAAPGSPQPILLYFSTLLETVKLNEIESVELARPVLQ